MYLVSCFVSRAPHKSGTRLLSITRKARCNIQVSVSNCAASSSDEVIWTFLPEGSLIFGPVILAIVESRRQPLFKEGRGAEWEKTNKRDKSSFRLSQRLCSLSSTGQQGGSMFAYRVFIAFGGGGV